MENEVLDGLIGMIMGESCWLLMDISSGNDKQFAIENGHRHSVSQ